MEYHFTRDEEYFLSQLLSKLKSNQSLENAPTHWAPDHFDSNRFLAAYFKTCASVNPESVIPNIEYYRSIKFTKEQTKSIDAWIFWIKARWNPDAAKFHSIKLLQEREAQSRYHNATSNLFGQFKRNKRKIENLEDTEAKMDDTWGRAKRPKLDGDGSEWREQD